MNRKDIDELIEKYGFSLEETHISWVLIGRTLVYKIKKPVDFGFLDYSALDKRLNFCKKEIELNRRLTKDMYLGVSTIVKTKNDLEIDKDGDIIEYAVRMKKIPQDKMMDVLIKENKVGDQHIKMLAKIITDFHAKADTDDYISSFGSVKINKANTDENFEQTKDGISTYITKYQYNTLKKYTDDFYINNEKLFDERIKNEKIRDCHGDMYSRNICIVSENEIYIYDCIEFNERFRYSDIASDVAFLLMDLENYSRYDLSDRFLKYYLEDSKDNDLVDVLTFYKIYRAYVRGKIAFFQQNAEKANKYFDLAFGYLPKDYKHKLIVMCGLTGSGKSYTAEKLSEKIDAVVINSDKTRKKLMGMDVKDKDLSDFKKGIYSPKITDKVYGKMTKDAYQFLREGKNVILDATYLIEKQRNDVEKNVKRLGIKPAVIFVDVDDKTAIEHFKKRENELNASDGRYKIYKEQKIILETPKKCIRIESKNSLKNNIEIILEEIV